MSKEVSVRVLMRDQETGEVVGENVCSGWTDDEGATVTMGIGNLPQLATAQPGDIRLSVFQPSVIYDPVTMISLVEDTESGMQTLTFDLPE